ncbi:hypothetical protein GQX74_006345 [Glossina fuscipes]|nr:hypothetical protein GQX74_006345 [Glossina fuscipes]
MNQSSNFRQMLLNDRHSYYLLMMKIIFANYVFVNRADLGSILNAHKQYALNWIGVVIYLPLLALLNQNMFGIHQTRQHFKYFTDGLQQPINHFSLTEAVYDLWLQQRLTHLTTKQIYYQCECVRNKFVLMV